MSKFIIIDVLLWVMVGSLAFAALCGASVLSVFTVKTITKMIKNKN